MSEKRRLTGIDLFRGIAIYAVIILHADLAVSTAPAGWTAISRFCLFAVPFFLATSFYLAVSKLYTAKTAYPLSSRIMRLLVPYVFWSVAYLLYKVVKYVVDNNAEQLNSLWSDPIALILTGDAAFHLYFLPLLMTGTLFVKFAEVLVHKQVRLWWLGSFYVLSSIAYQLVLASDNSFDISSGTAFEPLLNAIFPAGSSNPLLRVGLVLLAWSIRCLPYIFAAMILSHPASKELTKWLSSSTLLLTLGFLLINALGAFVLPRAVFEVLRGYITLFLAIALSAHLDDHPLIKSLGECSFGMYLVHLFFVEAFFIVVNRLGWLDRLTTPILLVMALVAFGMSWVTTSLLMKQKNLSKLMFGAS